MAAAGVARTLDAVVAVAVGRAAVGAHDVGPGGRRGIADRVVLALGDGAGVDVVVDLLVEQRPGHHRLRREVVLGRQVVVPGLIRGQGCIAAAAGERGVVEEGIVHHLVVGCPGDDLAGAEAEHPVTVGVVDQVDRRQQEVFLLGLGLPLAVQIGQGGGAAVDEAAARGLGIHVAHADIAAHRAVGEIQLRIGGIVGLFQRPAVVEVAGRIGIGEVQRAALDPVQHIVAAHLDVAALAIAEALDVGQPDGADVGQGARTHAAIHVQVEALFMLAVAHAELQLVEDAVELHVEVQLCVGVLAVGGEDAVVAEPAAGRTPVGRVAGRVGVVEGDALVQVPAEAAVVERFDEVLGQVLVLGLALADLAADAPTVALPGATQVQALGGHFRFAHVVVVDHRAAVGGGAGVGVAAVDHAVAHVAELVDRTDGARVPGQEGVHRLVVVVEVLLDVQAAEVELEFVGRLELQVDHGAVALAVLLEPGGVDRVGHVRIGVHARRIGEGGGLGVAEHFHALAVHALFIVLRGDVDAEGFLVVLPAVDRRGVRLALAGLVAVAVPHRGGHFIGAHVQRLAGMHQDGAAQAAFGQARFGGLDHFHAAQDQRRQQGVVEAAVGLLAVQPDRLRDRVAVQEGQVEAGIGAVDADPLTLAEATVQRDAGQLGQRLGDVGAGELADVLGGDRLGNGDVVALGVQRLFQAGADADDVDRIQVGRGGGGFLRLRAEYQTAENGCRKQTLAVVHDVSPHQSLVRQRRRAVCDACVQASVRPRYQLAAPMTPSCPCSTTFTGMRSSASRIGPLLRYRDTNVLFNRNSRICGRMPPAR
ncbi:hypothetical protein D3C71_1090690 [compost metagenome]